MKQKQSLIIDKDEAGLLDEAGPLDVRRERTLKRRTVGRLVAFFFRRRRAILNAFVDEYCSGDCRRGREDR